MPAPDTVTLVVCVVAALAGVVGAIYSVRRHRPGRLVQSIGLVLLPIALYLTGLLGLVVSGVLALWHWLVHVAFSPIVWAGFGLLALVVLLYFVGGRVNTRLPDGQTQRPKKPAKVSRAVTPSVGTGRTQPSGNQVAPAKKVAPVDDDMAEIEALLKSRGIK